MTARTPFRTAAETARLLGLTVKALRVFERHGLVQAQRTAVGWRVYGPNELIRLHQIIWLKRLGLKLTQIGAILHDQIVDLDRLWLCRKKSCSIVSTPSIKRYAWLEKLGPS
jgi:MerR family transcriptional regulator, thiopeptide resistance regulator